MKVARDLETEYKDVFEFTLFDLWTKAPEIKDGCGNFGCEEEDSPR
jgi:hypothetical protein